MPRASYPVEMAAHVAVVRAAVERVAAGEATRAALALLEALIGGESITAAQIGAVRDAAWAESRVFFKGDRDAGWAATAAGNACVMALRERGWQQVATSIMDAACCATPKDDGTRERLEALRTNVRTAPPPAMRQPDAPPRPRPRRLDAALERRIGSLAFAALRQARAVIDPSHRLDDAALRARLREKGFVAHAAALAFEARWGGLEFEEHVAGAGRCAEVGERGGKPSKRHGLVPVVYSDNDNYWFLARDGRAWAQDGIEDPDAVPFARDADCMVARIALHTILWTRRTRDLVVDREGSHGARIARALRVPAIRHATDDLERAWGNAGALVLDRGTSTIVAARTKALLARGSG